MARGRRDCGPSFHAAALPVPVAGPTLFGALLSKDRLERLIARSTDIVVATNRAGMVDYYNDGASRSLGYRPEEILGQYVARLYPDAEEAKRVMRAMREPGHGGRDIVETFQTTFLSKTGECIPVAISGTILRNEQGEEDGTIGFAKDLREILRKDQLATLGEVAVGLSHEINNPLAVILNQVQLLEQDVLRLAGERDCSVETERLDAMRREIGRITEILERLGKMAQSEAYETIEYIGPARMIDLRQRYEPAGDARLKGLRVLVADDDIGICRTMKELLEAEGCAVETASDGLEALRRLEAAPFDVVLTDVVMPNMDGYELYTTVHEKYPKLPVLMMTAFHYDRDHVIKRSRREGLEGVIFKKPVDPVRLREVLIETVSRH
jgi:PAS domain S-box-containing protein